MRDDRKELDNAAFYWLSVRASGTEVYCMPVRIREHIFALGYASQKPGEAFTLTRKGQAFLASPSRQLAA